jgi:uncharacterized membrane protein
MAPRDVAVDRPTAEYAFELAPPPALAPHLRLALTLGLGVATAIASAGFFLAGAWPVVGFLGLDVVLLWIAFRVAARRADRRERLHLTATVLTIDRLAPGTAPARQILPATWLTVRLVERHGRASRLVLSTHGREVEVGQFLSTPDREAVAMRLRAALMRLRLSPDPIQA